MSDGQCSRCRSWTELAYCEDCHKQELEEKIESLELDLETLAANAMRAMEIKDNEIACLKAKLANMTGHYE